MTMRSICNVERSVSNSARSASMSFNAVRFYSYCAFYCFDWRNAVW